MSAAADLAAVPESGTLFDPAPFIAKRVAVGLRGAGNLGLTDDEALLLKQADGNEDMVVEIRVFAKIKGYTKEYDTVVYNAAVIDATVVLD